MEQNQPTAATWKTIMEYIKTELLKQVAPMMYPANQYLVEAVAKTTVLSIPQLITLDGYLSYIGEKKVRNKVQIADTGTFEQFWTSYPASGNFIYKGMKFTATRSLRSNKEVCRMLYNRIIANGEVTPEQLLKAINTQVNLMKEKSYETGNNELQYLSAIEVWLRQEKFTAFLDIEEAINTEEENVDNNCA